MLTGPRRVELIPITFILLLAAFLRLYRLGDLPPGWRDDEVVETAVHAQRVLDGDFPLYFPEAEGHEPLYHYLSAGLIALAGRSLFVVRLLSVFCGLYGLAALYRLARRFFGPAPARLAALATAFSFWSLMYSRFKLRHISEAGLMLLAFYFFLLLMSRARLKNHGHERRLALLAGLFMGISLYTYFAARVAPLILLAFVLYLFMFQRKVLSAHGRGFALAFLVCGVAVMPLAWAIARLPGGETRLSLVGQPLLDLLHGDFTFALDNTRLTFGMFAFTGDPEYLYNIPNRPVFEAVGAALFLIGAGLSAWRWRQPVYAFLLIWLLGGLAPAFVSTPAASLGHTIAAQPVFYLFPAIALDAALSLVHGRLAQGHLGLRLASTIAGLALFPGLSAVRDLTDYFVRWPQLPEVRYLYRADLHAAAVQLDKMQAGPALALASRNLHQADVTALQLEMPRLNLQLRLFDPAQALVFPGGMMRVNALIVLRESAEAEQDFVRDWPPVVSNEAFVFFAPPPPVRLQKPATPLSVSFANRFTCLGYTLSIEPDNLRLLTYWRIDPGFTPPPARPIANLSGSPLPLKFFSHLLSADGAYLAGDDRLGVDPATLRAGDEFVQQFLIALSPLAPGDYGVSIGLYDPVSGARLPLTTGTDHLLLATFTR